MPDLTESLSVIPEPTTPAAEPPAGDSPPAALAPAAGRRKRAVAPRRRKEAVLPQIAQLALEGHNGRVIAEHLGMPTRTVNYWLQELRQEWIARAGDDAAATAAMTIARFESIYGTAMEEWRRSQTDKEVRLVEDSGPAGDEGGAKTKKSVRSETRLGNVAFLAKAIDAAKEIYRLRGCCALPSSPVAERIDWRTFTRKEWRHLSREDFAALEARLHEIEDEETEEVEDILAFEAAAAAKTTEAAEAVDVEAEQEETEVTPPPDCAD